MSPTVILLAVSALGIEVGWEPLPGGGHEYTIQLEPQMLEILKRGDDEIFSEVPADVEVRRYRLRVGDGKLSRVTRSHDSLPRTAEHRRAPHDSTEFPADRPVDDEPDPLRLPAPAKHLADPASGAAPAGEHAAPAAARAPPSLPRSTSRDEEGGGRRSEAVHAQKPATGLKAPVLDAEADRPWFAFTSAIVLLCGSLGANVYLGWTTWDARSRYRAALTKGRIASAT